MASPTQICNMAIGHLGIGKTIGDIDERTQEANACRTYYDIALDVILRDFNWKFARRFLTLALVEEDPTSEWAFSYQYPADCVAIRKILSGQRTDSRDTRQPYDLMEADTGKLILTDLDEAEMEYTTRSSNPLYYPGDFAIAFSRLLASYIAPQITGGDNFNISKTQLQIYEYEISKAKRNGLNEIQADVEPDSEFIRARE